jgi:hypothetical protein
LRLAEPKAYLNKQINFLKILLTEKVTELARILDKVGSDETEDRQTKHR